jgi:hypothetical protein
MELDDLKQAWKQTEIKQTPINKNIMEMIQHKSYGPVAALKKSYKKQMLVMSLLPILLLLTNINDISKVLTSIMFWSYIAFCIAVIIFAFYNYRITEKMQNMDGMVKANLEQQILLLEKRLRWKIAGLRIALLFFITLTEVLPVFQHYRMLDEWHSIPLLVRYGFYAALLVLQYYLSPKVLERKFGRHLTYLKNLAKEME